MSRVALVTGANKGIGLAIVRNLSKKFDGQVLLGSRSEERGQEALKSLKDEGISNIELCVIDIDDQQSIEKAKKLILEKYGGLDVLINNAGMAFRSSSTDPRPYQAEQTVKTNLIGTYNVCQAFFPILRAHARVSNMSSYLGLLKLVKSEELKKELSSESLTEARLLEMASEFVAACKDETDQTKGWPSSTYSTSKVLLSALTRAQQRSLDKSRPGEDIVINHTNPGEVMTNMTSNTGKATPDEGATSSLVAATLPHNTDIKGQYIDFDGVAKPWDA